MKKNPELFKEAVADIPLISILPQVYEDDVFVTQEEWDKLDKAVNDYFIDFKLKLYRICKLSDLEYQICLLLKIELSLADIAVLVHREPSTITMSRKRLYKKLFQKEGKAEELDVFIRSV